MNRCYQGIDKTFSQINIFLTLYFPDILLVLEMKKKKSPLYNREVLKTAKNIKLQAGSSESTQSTGILNIPH